MSRRIQWIVLVALFVAPSPPIALRGAEPMAAAPRPDSPTAEKPPVNDEQFHKQLLDIAVGYEKYGQYDLRLFAALIRCSIPPFPEREHFGRLSAAADQTAHAQKLYRIYASDSAAYRAAADKPQPVGQTVVKQSWQAKPIDPAALAELRKKPASGVPANENAFAEINGKLYAPERQLDLFIMTRLDPKTPGTDDGWVYGTVSADGKTVTSAGVVESCRNCHRLSKPDRLFGLQLAN